jgi:hypothetical protein
MRRSRRIRLSSSRCIRFPVASSTALNSSALLLGSRSTAAPVQRAGLQFGVPARWQLALPPKEAEQRSADTCLVIAGSGARDLLAMGSGVDFQPMVFGSGKCVRTRIAKLAVIVRALTDERFELFVDRSAGRYFREYLDRNSRDAVLRK